MDQLNSTVSTIKYLLDLIVASTRSLANQNVELQRELDTIRTASLNDNKEQTLETSDKLPDTLKEQN